nr:MAG TPA: TM2 domain [Bacteriophage sp.]
MSQKSIRSKNSMISLVLCLFLGYLGVHKFYEGKTKLGILYLFTVGLCGIGWIVDTIRLALKLVSSTNHAASLSNASTARKNFDSISNTVMPSKQNAIPDGEKDYNLLEDFKDGFVLCYEYERDLCLIDGAIEHISGEGGSFITFKQEPENPHDANAVAIYLGNIKLGYIYRRGNVQGMVNDYINRGWPVIGYINKYSITENHATYKIGFYKPADALVSKKFSIVKITKTSNNGLMSRAESLLTCTEGDVIDAEWDSMQESYVLYDQFAYEIGELPKSAETFLSDFDYNRFVCVLDECEETSDGKVKAKVTLYLSCAKGK